jgi:hypothetical protein
LKFAVAGFDLPQRGNFLIALLIQAMATLDELLKLADECYAHARASVNFITKAELMNKGDQYAKQAEVQRGSNVIQAAFPKPGRKIG